jgi:hypothetical protein
MSDGNGAERVSQPARDGDGGSRTPAGDGHPTGVEPLPGTLAWAVRLLLGEALVIGLIALYLLYEDLTAEANDLVAALFVTGFAASGAAVLVALARTLARRRAGARGLAVVLQLMLMAIGYYMIEGGMAWSGIPVMALGLTVAGLLVSPPTTRALGLG